MDLPSIPSDNRQEMMAARAGMEHVVIGNKAKDAGRALAQVESELHEAEIAFVDAETRLEAARRERAAALDKINQCQTEFDDIVAQRRQQSIPGSKWNSGPLESKDTLDLGPDDIVDNQTAVDDGPEFKVVSGEFDRLRAHVRSATRNTE